MRCSFLIVVAVLCLWDIRVSSAQNDKEDSSTLSQPDYSTENQQPSSTSELSTPESSGNAQPEDPLSPNQQSRSIVSVPADGNYGDETAALEGALGRSVRGRWTFPTEEDCDTPSQGPGSCMAIRRCPGLHKIKNLNYLRRFICGFEGNTPLLCCPYSFQQQEPQPQPQPQPLPQPAPRPRPTPIPPAPSPRPQPLPTPIRPPVTPPPANIEIRPRKPDFLPNACGQATIQMTRIVGGYEAYPGAWPWMAAIYVESSNAYVQACGGALVSNKHVVTAAHCVAVGNRAQNLPPSLFVIRLGDHNLAEVNDLPAGSTYDVAVEKIVRHPDFNPRTYLNDISIITLASQIKFTKYIQPLCLPYSAVMKDLTGYNAFVTGWGYTKYEGKGSDVLKQALIRIWDPKECKNAFKKEVTITDKYLCAGDGEGKTDSCQGDSGGPLVFSEDDRYYLIGVVSFGKKCATPGYPGAYTRITKYLQWLNDNFD